MSASAPDTQAAAEVPESDSHHKRLGNELLGSVFCDKTPRHFIDGVKSGALETVKGIAVGVGCLGMSVYAGVQQGTAQSVVTGALSGVAGLFGMTLYGAGCGVKKIVQGTLNTPDAVLAAADGDKVWDEASRMFVRIDLDLLINSLPPTDDDMFDHAKLNSINERRRKNSAKQHPSDPATSGSHQRSAADHYSVLGVSREATKADIRKAFTVKALELHPDKNPDPAAARAFQDVNEAYRVLSDAVLRAKYDAGEMIHDGEAPCGAAGSSSGSTDDINPLEEVFAGHAFLDWIGRLRYLLMMHPHLKFEGTLLEDYHKRKLIRAASHLLSLVRDECQDPVAVAAPSVHDMISSSKVGRDIVRIIAEEYLAVVRQYVSSSAVVREVDRFATGAYNSVSDVVGVVSNAGKAALHAYKNTVGESDMLQLLLAACTAEIRDTSATAALYVLIDAAATHEQRAARAKKLHVLSTFMLSLTEAAAAPQRSLPPPPERTTA